MLLNVSVFICVHAWLLLLLSRSAILDCPQHQEERLMSLRIVPATCLVAILGLAFVHAETCLSPFVKRLDRPEKILYVFCVDADAKDNDFLAVIDVDKDSPKYSQVIYQLDLGSSGNETHHFGFTDDRTHIWGLTLFSNRVFLIDVASDPARPNLVKVLEDIGGKAGPPGPPSPYPRSGSGSPTVAADRDCVAAP